MKNKEKYLELLEKAISFFPPNIKNLIVLLQGMIDESDTILDVGCGMKIITRNLVCKELVGIDVYDDYLNIGDTCADVITIEKYFLPKQFDIVIAIDLIEHLKKEDGIKLLKDMATIARRKVIVTTPIKWTENKEAVNDPKFWSYANEYDYHRSLWSEQDFYNEGYLIVPANFGGEFLVAMKEIV